MNTSKLKRFATDARTKLRNGVIAKLRSLGVDPADNDRAKIAMLPRRVSGGAMWSDKNCSVEFCDAFLSLDENIKRYGYRHVVEEAAYTWFNRFMAIRILAMNQLCEPVLRFVGEAKTPVIVDEARQGKIPEMKAEKRQELEDLLDDDTKTTEQFAILITAFCWRTPLLRLCFGTVRDYTNILVPKDILSEGGFIDMMNKEFGIENLEFRDDDNSPNSKFQNPYSSPELLGWLYQFYISERKDEVFAKKGKYETDDIAPATQIFTPNWIVKYMVQNAIIPQVFSFQHSAFSELKEKYKYLVEPAEYENCKLKTENLREVEDLRIADFACGSGHILNECFDLLYELYIKEGYSRKEAIENIFNKNLLGIDIDTRAKQLATFSLALKACQKLGEATLLSPDGTMLLPRIYGPEDAKHIPLSDNPEINKEIEDANNLLSQFRTLGSIIKFEFSDKTLGYVRRTGVSSLPVALTDHYDAIIMNPPYMPTNRIDDLSKYVNKHYKEGKADLFAVFMQVGMDRLNIGGNLGMINMQSWMFLSSYESLRKLFLKEYTISSMLHLGPRTFDELSGEVVQNTAFIIQKPIDDDQVKRESIKGTYYRLVDGKNCADKECMFLSGEGYYPNVPQANFDKIPGKRFGYWASGKMIDLYSEHILPSICQTRCGMATGRNDIFVMLWNEVSFAKIGFNLSHKDAKESSYKWFPYDKGGEFKKWYGNQSYIVDWENGGLVLLTTMHPDGKRIWAHNFNLDKIFMEHVGWSDITSSGLSFRYFPQGFHFDGSANALFSDPKYLYNILGFANSIIVRTQKPMLNPSYHFKPGDFLDLPYVYTDCDSIVKNCISISKQDWDAHETSWDFQCNELVELDSVDKINSLLSEVFKFNGINASREYFWGPKYLDLIKHRLDYYKLKWTMLFSKLHKNEEELNRQFIDIYGLQDELTPSVPLREITILQNGEIDFTDLPEYPVYGANPRMRNMVDLKWNDSVIIKQLISYALGCMMGRYRLDRPGLAIAHPNEMPAEVAVYSFQSSVCSKNPDGTENCELRTENFWIDDDGIIPLMPEDCGFHDNAANRLATFVRQVFGENSQAQNLNFIEQCLGKSIEQYFIKDFWKDHKKMYQNRPIYWLFASKNGAFQVLVYVHRMNVATVERIRSRYLLPFIERLNKRIEELEANEASLSTKESKRLAELRKQVDECTEYHNRLAVVAEKGIVPDLDDGIVANHAKYGDVVAKLK